MSLNEEYDAFIFSWENVNEWPQFNHHSTHHGSFWRPVYPCSRQDWQRNDQSNNNHAVRDDKSPPMCHSASERSHFRTLRSFWVWPFVTPIKILWWHLKWFESYSVDKQDAQTDITENNYKLRYAIAAWVVKKDLRQTNKEHIKNTQKPRQGNIPYFTRKNRSYEYAYDPGHSCGTQYNVEPFRYLSPYDAFSRQSSLLTGSFHFLDYLLLRLAES